MSCPIDSNTGFISLIGPIQTTDLNYISVKKSPLYFSFAAKTTPPTLINGNMIDESTGNSLTYKGKTYLLANIQICSVIHDNYQLPGQTSKPSAELILSFYASISPTDVLDFSGILLCVPIYDSGNPRHNDYLDQLIDPTTISCNYSNESGAEYEGPSYKTLNDTSLLKCVKACCDDTNCLAYTFGSGNCYLKNNISVLNKNKDSSIVSGKINRNNPLKPQCESTKKDNKGSAITPNIETIFYDGPNDSSQTSIGYNTCFETVDTNQHFHSKSLYVFFFPNGIHLTQQNYQNLLLRINNTLKQYEVPPAIRGPYPTLYKYQMNNGNKIVSSTSSNGFLYKTSISTCTDEFKTRFEYFLSPPFSESTRPNQSGKSSHLSRALDQCNYYKTTQYKCVPFDQLRDLSGEYVIPGNTSMDDIIKKQNEINQIDQSQIQEIKESVSMDTDDMEQIVGYVIAGSIVGFIVLFGVTKIFKS
jgi:hypothetical protein